MVYTAYYSFIAYKFNTDLISPFLTLLFMFKKAIKQHAGQLFVCPQIQLLSQVPPSFKVFKKTHLCFISL